MPLVIFIRFYLSANWILSSLNNSILWALSAAISCFYFLKRMFSNCPVATFKRRLLISLASSFAISYAVLTYLCSMFYIWAFFRIAASILLRMGLASLTGPVIDLVSNPTSAKIPSVSSLKAFSYSIIYSIASMSFRWLSKYSSYCFTTSIGSS